MRRDKLYRVLMETLGLNKALPTMTVERDTIERMELGRMGRKKGRWETSWRRDERACMLMLCCSTEA